MTATLIGYYPTLDLTNQNIQAYYADMMNDPLYAQDYTQNIMPMDSDVYQENKPWVPNPEFFSEDAVDYNAKLYGRKTRVSLLKSTMSEPELNEEGSGLRLAGQGISLAGYGISLAGRSKSRSYSLAHINNKLPDIVPTFPDNGIDKHIGGGIIKNAINDVQNISKEVINKADAIISKAPIISKELRRPLNKLTKAKIKKPGSGLRKKLAKQMGSSGKRAQKPSLFQKREYVKELLRKLHPNA